MQLEIAPTVIRWARERARIPVEKLAKTLNRTPENVNDWERGKSSPTLSQAQRLADALHIPFGYLFLPGPPEEQLPLPDFRTVGGAEVSRPSADLIDVIDSVLLKQDWYRQFVSAEGRKPLPFVGRFTAKSVIADVSKDISKALHVDDTRAIAADWEDFLRFLISQAEELGILVMKTGVVEGNTHRPLSVNEFRGFAISDRLAPLVFINGRDAQTAQIFTLIHELTHIWIGASGISNESLKQSPSDDLNSIERFCNAVAAEVLVPAADFATQWTKGISVDEKMRQASRRYKVSTVVVLRRALDLHKLTWEQFLEHYRKEDQRFKTQKAKSKGGDYFTNLIYRNSAALASAVVGSTLEGKVLFRDGARMLNTSVPNLQKLALKLAQRRKSA